MSVLMTILFCLRQIRKRMDGWTDGRMDRIDRIETLFIKRAKWVDGCALFRGALMYKK